MRGVLRAETRPDGETVLMLQREDEAKARRVGESSLDPSLRGKTPTELDGMEVELGWHKGQARQVRPAGTDPTIAYVAQSADEPTAPSTGGSAAPASGLRNDIFHNPYTFIPTPDRPTEGPLADGPPPGHDHLAPDRWTGRIRVTMTTETPLLVLDTARRREDRTHRGHYVYDPLVDDAGAPLIPPTQIKGMLRSSYEAVTNSRFGVFEGHGSRLAYRMVVTEALKMVPARVTDDGRSLQLLPGTARVGGQGGPTPMYAAWIRQYPHANPPIPTELTHRSEVRVVLEQVQHHRWDRRAQRHVPDFRYWAVRGISGADGTPHGAPARPDQPTSERSWHEPLGGPLVEASGWLCVTNRNIGKKHDERVFFVDGSPPPLIPITKAMRDSWEDVVKSYRDAHTDADLFDRRDKVTKLRFEPHEWMGKQPGSTAWSPHTYAGRRGGYPSGAERLEPGAVVYARVDGAGGAVKGLFPVMIARDLYEATPEALLHHSLKPAESTSRLSPADRVFGWVGKKQAYRGNLRVGPVTCNQGTSALRRFGEPVPLAILGQPRPQQGRFYVGEPGPSGPEPLAPALPKPDLYAAQRRALRGRKIYPRQASLPTSHWADADRDRTGEPREEHFQEYRRPGGVQDNQNRSITGWVAPASTFTFDLDVKNLSPVELGALVWMLSLDKGHCLRLGLAKPLGFGSVAIAIDWNATSLAPGGGLSPVADGVGGSTWASWYLGLESTTPPAALMPTVEETVTAFKQAVAGAHRFEDAPYIKAFLAAAAGDPTTRVHYPRVRPIGHDPAAPVGPSIDSQAFEWFVANERQEDRRVMRGRGVPLPPAGGEGLPIYEAGNRPGGGDHRPQERPAGGPGRGSGRQ